MGAEIPENEITVDEGAYLAAVYHDDGMCSVLEWWCERVKVMDGNQTW